MRRPPDPEVVRRAVARRRSGESFGAISQDCGVCETTIRRWVHAAGNDRPAPEILRQPPPPGPSPVERDALPAELEALAVELLEAGLDDRAALVRRARDALATRVEDADVDMPDPGADTRGWIVAMISRTQRSYDVAEKSHNATAAKQFASTLERWGASLRQYDAAHSTDDAIVIPRADLDERMARLRELIASLTSEPLRCADCGRRVRVSWAD